jgi:hypothetical protein
LAAILTSAIGELGTLLGGTGVTSTLARGALTGLGAVAAGDLLAAIQHDLASGGSAAAQARHIPQYAIIDLHTNKVVRTLSAKHVYTILTHPRGHRRPKQRAEVVIMRGDERAVTVR